MIDIVIKYDDTKQTFGIYEPTTNTYMLSANLSEGLVYLEKFLKDSKLIDKGLLDADNITYHLDSKSMKGMIESNVNLMKRLNNAPSGFMMSQQRFGGGSSMSSPSSSKQGYSGKGKSRESSFSKPYFSHSGFKSSFKKFGNK